MSTILTEAVKFLIEETTIRKFIIVKNSGVSHSTIHGICSGDTDNCRAETIEKIIVYIMNNDKNILKRIPKKFPLNIGMILEEHNKRECESLIK